jgi:large subunit ribosomal protein L6
VSRVGRMPIIIPAGVHVEVNGTDIGVKGPKGEMKRKFSPLIGISMENDQINITRNSDRPAERALHGTTRAVLANMIHGVGSGFERVLEIEGVGYRAEMNGKILILYMGYSHPVEVEPPAGITFDVDQKTRQVFVRGFDKELVGQVAANVRNVRPPEPYHGKGLHYLGEKIRRKAGKAGKAAA